MWEAGSSDLGDVVVAVAVVAGRDVLAPQGDGLAVEGVAVAFQLRLVTLAAHAVGVQSEFGRVEGGETT